jgi:putative DNA primase/helicase
MVSLARQEPGIPVLPEQLDADPWVLNCPNGTLDLRNGRLGPHIRGDLLTKRTGVPFDPYADCPTWEAFLERIMGSDSPLMGFLRRAVGYALVGVVTEHVLFFLYGRGRNGKSTFLNTILFALGDYAITVNADLLTSKGQDEHPTGVADLQGRRFVSTIEVEDGRRMAESLVKTLTGADRIRARRMRQDFYEFDPTHTLFLAANHKPTVRGTDEGIWRRIKLVPFKVQIPDDEVDRDLPARLRAEAPGVLAWAVRGCLEWQAEGLAEPAAVAEATADYRAEMDVLADFLGERCQVAPGLRARAGPLYRAYAEWAKDTGNHQLSMNKFGRLLSERGFPPEKSNSTAWRLGLAMRDP